MRKSATNYTNGIVDNLKWRCGYILEKLPNCFPYIYTVHIYTKYVHTVYIYSLEFDALAKKGEGGCSLYISPPFETLADGRWGKGNGL